MTRVSIALLSAGAAFLSPGIALAQDRPETADAAALRAEITALKAQLADMEKRLDRLGETSAAPSIPPPPPAQPKPEAEPQPEPTSIAWEGSPEFTSGDRAFKAKGRIQVDAGYVSRPSGLEDRAFGFASEFRRLRLGGEGSLGGGVGYKLELELSDNAVDLVDTFVTYEADRWRLAVGNHNAFQSLDELTGDTTGSFMERAAFTDAFNFERRLGVSAQYRRGPWLLQAGAFSDDPEALANASDGPDGGDENNSFSLDQRLVYAPKVLGGQLHLGGSVHWRDLKRVAEAPTRYRQRAYLHANNTRVLATPELSVDKELNYGVEAAFIRGRWHAVAETHWMRAQRQTGPALTFFGGYGEVGYFLTKGDTRKYGDGQFGRSTPKRDLTDGGLGSVQLNLRYDYLSLNDGPVRGGEQRGYLAAIIWSPLRELRLNLNYGYLDYSDPAVGAGGAYHVHVTGARLELDF